MKHSDFIFELRLWILDILAMETKILAVNEKKNNNEVVTYKGHK